MSTRAKAQESGEKVERNESRYRKLSEPFESLTKVNEVLEAFYRDLGELREKHKIPDLYVVVKGTSLTESGEEGDFSTSLHFGNSLEAESMLAWALGREQARRQERIATLLRQGLRHAKDER